MNIWQATAWVRDTAFDFWQIMHPVMLDRSASEDLKWKPPALGWVKCNSDAAYYAENSHGVSACVL